jgi:hypothetical protein
VGLLVTGKRVEGEALADPLNRLFSSLVQDATVHFEVEGYFPQLSPRAPAATRTPLKLVGTDKGLADRDEELFLKSRGYLCAEPGRFDGRFVILVDDVECRPWKAVFDRYRQAFDHLSRNPSTAALAARCGVHFFKQMVEAYFFAIPGLLDSELGAKVESDAGCKDVEDIPHPKNLIFKMAPNYHENLDAIRLLRGLRLDDVLKDESTCCFLRSMVNWVLAAISRPCLPGCVVPELIGQKLDAPMGKA